MKCFSTVRMLWRFGATIEAGGRGSTTGEMRFRYRRPSPHKAVKVVVEKHDRDL